MIKKICLRPVAPLTMKLKKVYEKQKCRMKVERTINGQTESYTIKQKKVLNSKTNEVGLRKTLRTEQVLQ